MRDRFRRSRGAWLVAAAVAVTVMAGGGVIERTPMAQVTPTPTPTATPDGCAVETANVPDGPDPWGGCWPGPSNTGPDAPEASMAAYTGACNITAANVTIDSRVINCSTLNLASTANNFAITNSYIKGGVISFDGATYSITDSELDNAIDYPACTSPSSCSAGKYACGDPNNATTECGTGYSNYTLTRVEIHNTNRSAYCASNCLIQDSYFHGTTLWPDHTNLAHASGVRNEQYLTLRHNSVACDYQGPFPNGDLGCSADMSGYPDFAPVNHATIDRNLFGANNAGIAFCTYGGATNGKPYSSDPTNATYMVFTDNVWQKGANGKCGQFGPITDWNGSRTGNVDSGNTWDDGSPLDLDDW